MILCFVSVLGSCLSESNEFGTETSTELLFNKAQDAKLRRASEYLQKNFAQDLKISALARYSGMSERSLNRAFIMEFGLAPKQALLRFRLEKARELLKLGEMSVTEVCYEVGYSSLSRFIQAYRSTFGRLPSEESL
jgi:transcriptional regulator GlxA family with amidase domain